VNRNTALYLPDIISSQVMSSADEFVISSTVPLKIGFLGLGNMGSRIVGALLQSGHDVTVWNRTPSKVFVNNILILLFNQSIYFLRKTYNKTGW